MHPYIMKVYFIAAKSIGLLQKDLDATREAQIYAKSQHEAGRRVLSRNLDENKRLKAENKQQAEEIESLKSQLAQALEKNQKLKGGIFGKSQIQCSMYVNDHNIFEKPDAPVC